MTTDQPTPAPVDAYKLRAEPRAGELLALAPKHPESRNTGRKSGDDTMSPPKLKEIGISPKQSERWQAEASVPAPSDPRSPAGRANLRK